MNTTSLNTLSSNREVFHKALAHRYFQPNPMLNVKAYSAHKLVEHHPNNQSTTININNHNKYQQPSKFGLITSRVLVNSISIYSFTI